MAKSMVLVLIVIVAACGGEDLAPAPDAADELGVPAFEACSAYSAAAASAVRICGGDVAAHRTRWAAICATFPPAVTIPLGEYSECVDAQRGALWRPQPCAGGEVAWQADARACLETFGGP